MTRHRLPWLFGGVGLLAVGLHAAVSPTLLGSILYVGVAVSAAVAIVVGARLNRPARLLPWLLVGGGLGAIAAGELVWEVYEQLGRDPFPSPADFLYLASYPLMGAGLLGLARSRGVAPARSRASLVDAGIVAVAAAVPAWIFLVRPAAGDDSLTFAGQVLSIAYPVGDLVLLTLLVRLLFSPRSPSAAFGLLAGGIVFTIVSDVGFAAVELSGAAGYGGWLDTGWLLGFLLLGTAALHTSMATVGADASAAEPSVGRLRLATLALASFTAPAVLAIDAATGEIEHVVVITVGAAILPVLALLRLVVVLRELERVAEERHGLLTSERAARAEAESARRLLAEQNDRLRELDRLKDEFVALVSHELRTPLTSITGYLELVLDGDDLNADQQRFLDVVDRNARRLLRLVTDLLFVAQIESGKLTIEVGSVDLHELAADSVEALQPVAESKGVELRLDATATPSLQGDAARLAQLLDNLISNAVKFTPDGGRVVVAIGRSAQEIVLAVTDTGIGVPAAEQRRLFDRFFRASAAQERAIEGTGLGLTIARAIVDAHGGEIEVASVEGEGTTFRVRLPIGVPAKSARAVQSRTEHAA